MELLMLVEGTASQPREGSEVLSRQGEWIANCKPDRVDRIQAASVFLLKVGPPQPNQLQTKQDLEERGLVGLYRIGEKTPTRHKRGTGNLPERIGFHAHPVHTHGLFGGRGGRAASARYGQVLKAEPLL